MREVESCGVVVSWRHYPKRLRLDIKKAPILMEIAQLNVGLMWGGILLYEHRDELRHIFRVDDRVEGVARLSLREPEQDEEL